MTKAVIVDGCRTPFLKVGTIKNLSAVEMALAPVKHLQKKYGDLFKLLDRVIGANIGNQIMHPDGSNLARVIQLNANIPQHIGAYTININCASGLMAVIEAVKEIELGLADAVLVVAVEVMSDYVAVYPRQQRAQFAKLYEVSRKKAPMWRRLLSLIKEWVKMKMMPHKPEWAINLGLTDPVVKLRMDQIADKIAKEYNISREEQDLFALESQRRAKRATQSGRFKEEIVPLLRDDNGIRFDQNLEMLARLKPRYEGGTATPGNSSQISDGAVALILASEEFAAKYGLPKLATMSSKKTAVAGCDPAMMGLGPVKAIQQILNKNDMRISDIDLLETNEAFASVVLAQLKDLKQMGLDVSRVNVNGGAIALGHPISASGARLVLTCAKELEYRKATTGLVTLCVGGGQGVAALLERGF